MPPTPTEIASAAKTAGWLTKKASEIVAALRDRKIAFVKDPHKIQRIKDTRQSAEYQTFSKFAGSRQRALIQLGLYLRTLANDDEIERLRTMILRNFEPPGLHPAEAVQHGALTIIHQALLDAGLTEENFEAQMTDVLVNVDKYVFFVQWTMEPGMEATALLARLRRDNPTVFVIAALGGAKDNAKEIVGQLSQTNLGYEIVARSEERRVTYILTQAKTT